MSRLTHLCLAQSFSTLGTRFRALRQNCRRLHPPRHDPDHAEAACGKPLVMNPNFVDGLLGFLKTDGTTITAQNRKPRGTRLCRSDETRREVEAIFTSSAHLCSASRKRSRGNRFERSTRNQ